MVGPLRTEISHETIGTKTNASSFFSDRTIVRIMKKKTKKSLIWVETSEAFSGRVFSTVLSP
jgi:hypothetical protein